MTAEFVPIRWWQTADFIRINLEMTRGRDPWADRVLSRPWSLYSLLEYAYMLINLISSYAYFIVADGERVGVFWLIARSRVLYILSLGLLSHFRTSVKDLTIARLLIRAVRTIEDLSRRPNCETTVARIAARNEAIQRMTSMFQARPLGLSVTTLTLSPVDPTKKPPSKLEARRIKKSEAIKAWRKWKIHAAENTSGSDGAKAAVDLLEAFDWLDPLPKGKHYALYKDDQEVGFAFTCQRGDKLELGLFPSGAFWLGPQTTELVAALTAYINAPIRYLTLTQKHADALDTSATPLQFERNRDQERYFVFWLPAVYFAASSRDATK
jgi:hypothetical protein